MLEAFRKVAIVIDERGVVFQHAALYLEVVDAARERIGKRFEDKEGKRLAVIVLALKAVALAAGVLEADLGVLIGVRERVSKKSEQAGGADIAQRGGHQHGEDFFSHNGFANGRDEIVDGDGAFAEKLFHHFVVAFGDHFNKFFVSFLSVISESGGDFFDGRFSIAAGSVDTRFHGYKINDAAKSFFAADGHLQGDYVAAENFLEGFHGAFETGEFAVHPGEHEGAGNVVLRAVIPNFFGGDLRADVGVYGDERGIGGDERGFGFGDERGITGEIDEDNFDIFGRFGAVVVSSVPISIGENRLNVDHSADVIF